MASDGLPNIPEIIKSNNLITKKSLGQHFLTDQNLLDKIVRHAGKIIDSTVLEIGPGPGGLTRSILQHKPKKLIVIEKDRRCITILNEVKNQYSDILEIIENDALKISASNLNTDRKITVISNLPYNIGTKILLNFLNELENIESMTLMFQKEVAERIVAQPKRNSYGRLSIICQWLCKTELLFDISPNAFIPPPKVDSSVVSIIPREKPLYDAKRSVLEKICEVTFGKRRKMLRSSLKSILSKPEEILEIAEINPQSRPEELSIEQFCKLARAYEGLSS